ncbi:arginine repressor, ArgR [Caldicellulosiruptor saccharolyticus DSM 8903]|uniref:Arginine repressor n=1 Tax=Caldicellulosiruptor saccharolyticus (strain ATCC 43494 / DSM 8903 / Tp8T 6331) TaxID=351627 RepID=ARGR_CALS8|nr:MULTISPECIES: arginine repressor [Caldicellulosiruptor]A4XKP7.1 RecName: Full=Arginine repressor [Caldicellulosiruptor saccharolyticus DSM 8903]ABP67482.1 arginine repressor, ArgR [Caldicellulosiruptor saccharolyticus DSM 8903]
MKSERQQKILEIIQSEDIETQEELVEKLRELGYDVTQATVSRDIKELRLTKVLTETGKYKYAVLSGPEANITEKLIKVFSESIIKYDTADNLVIIKTITGAAQGAAAAIDSLNWPEVIGTIAGDDTIFIATKGNAAAEKIVERIKAILSQGD